TLNALDRHVALIGFMGAGKTTLAGEVASRLARSAIDADRLIEGRVQVPLGEFFAKRGELEFRVVEAAVVGETLRKTAPAVIALGGGAVKTASVRKTLSDKALTVLVEIDVDTAWQRVRGSNRPLAQDETAFRRLYAERQPLYREAADAVARDADGA